MLDKELFAQERLEICKKCLLYKEDAIRGPICDSNKFISKDGAKWSWFRKDGFVRGCGCGLKRKVKNPNNHCIINLW